MIAKLHRGLLMAVVVSGLLALPPVDAQALNFEYENGIGLDLDVTLSYGAAWRTRGPDKEALADINMDDGNRNFDKGDMITNRFSVTAEADLHKDNYGVFLRSRAFYDYAYDGKNGNDSPFTNNNAFENGGNTAFNKFSSDTKDAHRDDVELLDAFAYGTKSFGDTHTMLRIGQQTINWGESLYLLQGINGATAYLDVTKANIPGVEVEELLMPTEQVYAEVTNGPVTVAGFYQWEWEKNRLDESGSFFATDDYLDEAGERILVDLGVPGIYPSVDRAGDDDAKDSGQWGVAVRYNVEQLNDTEFGLYFVNYHEKMPILRETIGSGGNASPIADSNGGTWSGLLGDPDTEAFLDAVDYSSYYLEYVENVKMIGGSVSGVLGNTNVAGEVSYRYDMPIAFAEKVPGSTLLELEYDESEYVQGQISTFSILPGTFLYDQLTIITELGFNRILDNKDLPEGYDRTAYGGVFAFEFDYFQVLQKTDLKVPLTITVNPKGSSPILGTFTEDANAVNIGTIFTYDSNYKLSLAYTAYLNDPDENVLSDRDFFSANIKYTF